MFESNIETKKTRAANVEFIENFKKVAQLISNGIDESVYDFMISSKTYFSIY